MIFVVFIDIMRYTLLTSKW